MYLDKFLDDCFIPWTKSEEELKHFNCSFYNLTKDITLTLEYSTYEQPFQDVMV